MSTRSERFWCAVTCWGAAAAVGTLAFVMLIVLGDWMLIQAVFAAGVILLGLGAGFQALFCRPLPPPIRLSGAKASVAVASAPETASGSEPVAATAPAGRRPAALAVPEGAADDLKRIKGVGPKLETMLNDMGIHHYRQIAAWGPEEVAWCDEHLEGFRGRVSRDAWVAQAKILAAGGETEFSQRSDGR